MKNLLYNLGALLFAVVQTYVAAMAFLITAFLDDNNLPMMIIFWVILVGFAFLDKLIRGIHGKWQILLCLIVSPLRGPIQLIVVILTIVNIFRRTGPISERGEYDDDSFVSTIVYVATGYCYISAKTRVKGAAAREAIAQRQQAKAAQQSKRMSTKSALLEKHPDYFQLEEAFKQTCRISGRWVVTGHLATGDAGIRNEKIDISYNDTYTEMEIVYSAEVYPIGDPQTIKRAYAHYSAACRALSSQAQNLAASEIKSYMQKWPFRGSVKWKSHVTVDYMYMK